MTSLSDARCPTKADQLIRQICTQLRKGNEVTQGNTNGTSTAPIAPTAPPDELRRVATPTASALAEQLATFEELQTVLRCCERLVSDLAAAEPDDVVLEGVWTTALLSYGRCFATGQAGTALTEADLTATKLQGDVLKWHSVLLQMRDYYTDGCVNPRERFSVGVALDGDGAASGVGMTSARQPSVDDLTVRQTGAIAYALSALVDERIAAQQEKVFEQVKKLSKAELSKLTRLELAEPEPI